MRPFFSPFVQTWQTGAGSRRHEQHALTVDKDPFTRPVVFTGRSCFSPYSHSQSPSSCVSSVPSTDPSPTAHSLQSLHRSLKEERSARPVHSGVTRYLEKAKWAGWLATKNASDASAERKSAGLPFASQHLHLQGMGAPPPDWRSETRAGGPWGGVPG